VANDFDKKLRASGRSDLHVLGHRRAQINT
jgi:hypothetical protein